MDAVVDHEMPYVTSVDGRQYPLFQLTAAERATMVEIVHRLTHEQQMSRQAVRAWLAERGVRRSYGAITSYLAERCPDCPERPQRRQLKAS
jgi:hypothetical protein